ncbi:hypothetical protein CBL_12460 [Carabus blaptoides fortunei]
MGGLYEERNRPLPTCRRTRELAPCSPTSYVRGQRNQPRNTACLKDDSGLAPVPELPGACRANAQRVPSRKPLRLVAWSRLEVKRPPEHLNNPYSNITTHKRSPAAVPTTPPP